MYIYIIRHGRDISKIDLIRNKNQYWSFNSMTFDNCNFQFTILQYFHHRLYPSSSLRWQDNAWKAVPQKVQFPCNLSCWMDSNYVLLDHQQVDIACECVCILPIYVAVTGQRSKRERVNGATEANDRGSRQEWMAYAALIACSRFRVARGQFAFNRPDAPL